MKNVLLSLAIAVSFYTLAGCNAYRPHFLTIRANYNVSRGDYQPAIVDYLRAQDNRQYARWLSYNLGTVYHYLGESNAALERWEYALGSDAADLVYSARFNTGVFFFEQGRNREARRYFRAALESHPTSTAAKRNLELTLERLTAEADLTGEISGRTESSENRRASTETRESGSRMLDYVRRKEEQRWRANRRHSVNPQIEDW